MPCNACHQPHPVIDQDFDVTNLFSVVDTLKSKNGSTYLPSVLDKKGTTTTFIYSLTDDTDGTGVENAGRFCMACHDRTGMITKGDCWNCHMHGSKF